MPELRYEIIIRLPGLRPQQVPVIEKMMGAAVRRLGGTMSRIERERFEDGHEMHVSRKKVI